VTHRRYTRQRRYTSVARDSEKGDLSGSEDLVVDGEVDGSIALHGQSLSVTSVTSNSVNHSVDYSFFSVGSSDTIQAAPVQTALAD
jgi:hypothetical protein